MNQDRDKLIEMAKQAGFEFHPIWKTLIVKHSNGSFVEVDAMLEAFYNLAIQDAGNAEPIGYGILASNTMKIVSYVDVSDPDGEVATHNPDYVIPLYTSPQPSNQAVREALEKAIKICDDMSEAHHNLGITYGGVARHDDIAAGCDACSAAIEALIEPVAGEKS